MSRTSPAELWAMTVVIGNGRGSPKLYTATIDKGGQLPLRQPAADLAWYPGLPLGLTLVDGVVRLRRLAVCDPPGGTLFAVRLDARHRVHLPFGPRLAHGLLSGINVAVLTNPVQGEVVAVPVIRLVAQYAVGP